MTTESNSSNCTVLDSPCRWSISNNNIRDINKSHDIFCNQSKNFNNYQHNNNCCPITHNNFRLSRSKRDKLQKNKSQGSMIQRSKQFRSRYLMTTILMSKREDNLKINYWSITPRSRTKSYPQIHSSSNNRNICHKQYKGITNILYNKSNHYSKHLTFHRTRYRNSQKIDSI